MIVKGSLPAQLTEEDRDMLRDVVRRSVGNTVEAIVGKAIDLIERYAAAEPSPEVKPALMRVLFDALAALLLGQRPEHQPTGVFEPVGGLPEPHASQYVSMIMGQEGNVKWRAFTIQPEMVPLYESLKSHGLLYGPIAALPLEIQGPEAQ